MRPWDRQDGEPVRAFERFERFRLLGPNRSLDAAYRAQKGAEGRGERAPGAFRRLAEEWNWASRAEAWDLEVAEESRREAEKKYKARLTKHQDESLQIADGILAAAGRGLKLVNLRLKRMLDALEVDERGRATNDPELLKLDLDAVIQLLNATSRASKLAVEIKATTLSVQELLNNLDKMRGES